MFSPEKEKFLGQKVVFGQKKVAVTNTAVVLGTAQQVKNGLIVQALSTNSGSIYIGDSSVTVNNGFELQPGQATSVAVDGVEKIYINGTANDGVCYVSSD